jgi:hypothetical protein
MSGNVLDNIAKQLQSYYRETPVIVLGSGASAAFNIPGMKSLAKHLIDTVDATDLSDGEQVQWGQFVNDLNNGVDLESCLQKNTLSEVLTDRVIHGTWMLLNPEDLNVFNRSILTHNFYPLSRLLHHMFDSTHTKLDVITTNYDRIAEYACEEISVHHYTGFTHGYRRVEAAPDELRAVRTVNIWKVHGSLDWFKGGGINIALSNVERIPARLTPLIVTPGVDKYVKTTREPFRTIIANADKALTSAKSYLCVGYGFNDIHIQEKLVNKCVRDGGSIIVISRSLSESAKRFLFDMGTKEYVALCRGSSDSKTKIYSSELDKDIEVDGDYWSLLGFMQLIM